MGATFDPQLIRDIGLKLLAPEAKLKAASLALAPTCNIQRVRRSLIICAPKHSSPSFLQNPLGGRVQPLPRFSIFSNLPRLTEL